MTVRYLIDDVESGVGSVAQGNTARNASNPSCAWYLQCETEKAFAHSGDDAPLSACNGVLYIGAMRALVVTKQLFRAHEVGEFTKFARSKYLCVIQANKRFNKVWHQAARISPQQSL